MTRKDNIAPATTKEEKDAAFYDHYDYNTFWEGRDYEHEADAIAVVNFLKKTKTPGKCIIDVGGGLGRLVPKYAHLFDEAILLDPSAMQLEATKDRIGAQYQNLSFIRGIAEHIPVEDNSVDTIVCVRVSHHLPEIQHAISEFERVLMPGGHLILDVANKAHMKARLAALKDSKKRRDIRSHEVVEVRSMTHKDDVPFVNHHPHAVMRALENSGFEIVSIRSVSNLRSRLLKKILPLSLLVFVERIIQSPLAKLSFGPSIFMLARKK